MSNPYLERLKNLENRHPSQPTKLTKPGSVGFVGDLGCCVSGFFVSLEGASPHSEILKDAIPNHRQNRQNPPRCGLRHILEALDANCPDHIEPERWRQVVEDGRRFLASWDERVDALGWTPRDLFGLHTPPESPHPSYRRLSRYDATGLIWLLEGREVIALTTDTAAIRWPSGSVTVYRRNNKPGLGPLGNSLDD